MNAWDVIVTLFPDVQEELWELSIDEFKSRIQAVSLPVIGCIYAG
jgi:hypothetical protein